MVKLKNGVHSESASRCDKLSSLGLPWHPQPECKETVHVCERTSVCKTAFLLGEPNV